MSDFKLSGNTFDSVEEDISTLKELFPSIVTEDNEIDFDELRDIFEKNGETVVDDSEEHYKFTWWGKKETKRVAKESTTKTLRPLLNDSKNWEDTENIYIEGDNLESLKILLGAYRNSIKMIYIDPPYNTGKDFVYKDNRSENIKEHLENTGQLNEDGFLFENAKTDGKFHSNWLNMMYPRLYLARKFLTEDGVIFVHIDDNELFNLEKIMDEIFGENCFVNLLTIKTKVAGVSGSHLGKSLQNNAEYILIYSKNELNFHIDNIPKDKKELFSFITEMELNNKSWKYTSVMKNEGDKEYVKSIKTGNGDEIKIFKHSNYQFMPISKISKNEFDNDLKKAYYAYIDKIFRTTNAQSSIRRRIMDETKDIDSDLISIEYIPTKGKNEGKLTKLYYKDKKRNLIAFLSDVVSQQEDGIYKLDNKGNIWTDINYNNLKNEASLSFPNGQKPIQLINYLMDMFDMDNELIMDFFSGSATTAHSVMYYNLIKNSNCNFIMVQIPEEISKKDNLYSEGFKNICDVGKERIRRAGDKILEESDNKDLDIGFKVFKVDESNFIPWNPVIENESDANQAILSTGNNIVEGRSELDLIYELMLKHLNVELTCPFDEKTINNHKIYVIDEGYALICLDFNIDESITGDLLNLKEELMTEHCEVILRDDALDDNLAINIYETLKSQDVEFHTI